MIIDELLARKREILGLRKEETDEFALTLLNEELADLNAQLRSLRGAPRAQGTTNSRFAMDYASYADWLAGERDDEVREARRAYFEALGSSGDVLTERQLELFRLWQDGMNVTELAERFGVDKSTVSRTLTRGKKRLREEAERLSKQLRMEQMTVYDLSDYNVARVLLSCLTNHQAVCIYLYYGEWLNLRECGELLGIDHTAVLRAVQRGLRAIQDTLRCEAFTLDNVDALGDLAYELYLEAGAPGDQDFAPTEKRTGAWARKKLGYEHPKRAEKPLALCSVRTSDGLVSENGTAHESLDRPMGKLLTLLYALHAKHGALGQWLKRLFEKITKKKGD